MDKNSIITYWSYEKPTHTYKLYDIISENLSKFYSDLNGLDLVSLNLLNESFHYYYWYICNKTNELYFLNITINDRDYQLSKDMIQALSEVNRYVFKQINFELEEVESTNNSNMYIHTITINQTSNHANSTKYFAIKNLTVEDKSVLNLNKPSRTIRYLRRQILSNNKRKYDDNNDTTIITHTVDTVDTINTTNSPNPKRRKTVRFSDDEDIWKDMIAASACRNYMLNDPLIDFFKEYNIYSLEDKPSKVANSRTNIQVSVDTFTKHIMDAGIEFEEELIKIIKQDHSIVKVAEFIQSKQKEKFDETIQLMKQGVPIIYQAVLHNYDNKTFGLPDLLVRSDYLNQLMGYQVITPEEAKRKSPKLNVPWHYKVIDIKHSNIPLRSDGIHILNSESIPAYKGQIYIYTMALNNVLGININKAYIWGKKYLWESKGIKYENSDFLNKLGVIDYDSVDSEYIEQTNNAIEWIRAVRNEGSTWKLLPLPSRKELFPNMKNEKDGQWRKLKNELNDKINEITAVIYCGVKHRQNAHANQVFQWTDPKCTSKVLGFNPKGKQSIVVDSVLNINRQSTDLIRPEFISWDRKNWKQKDPNELELYLDFETLNSNFGSIIKDGIISYNSNQFIFMVGVGYIQNNTWIFKNFVMKDKSGDSEVSMFNNFYKYIDRVLKQTNKKTAKFYHWSCAEPSAYNSFKKRNHGATFNDKSFKFYDLYQVFISEPIVVKGALNYSLKTIAKSLNKHTLIKSNWNSSSPCSNGLSAMILANNLYEKVSNNLIDDVEKDPVMKEIIYYNEIDCKVMWEIHNLIRNNF